MAHTMVMTSKGRMCSCEVVDDALALEDEYILRAKVKGSVLAEGGIASYPQVAVRCTARSGSAGMGSGAKPLNIA